MENSRHEKAALVAIAYVIGGITAFIAFGINVLSVPTLSISSQATAVLALPPVTTTPGTAPTTLISESIVSYIDGMLEVETLEGVQVLSFNPTITGLVPGSDFLTQGYHYAEPVWRVSTSGQFVFFCEQRAPTSSDCSPFVYDLLRQTIHRVSLAGSTNAISTSLAESAGFVGEILVIGNLRSVSEVSPWQLSYR